MTPQEVSLKVKIGMTRDEVKAVLGEPHDIGRGTRKYPRPCVWKYGVVELHFHYSLDGGVGLVYYEDENDNPITLQRESP